MAKSLIIAVAKGSHPVKNLFLFFLEGERGVMSKAKLFKELFFCLCLDTFQQEGEVA